MCVHVSTQMCVHVSIQMCVHVSTQMCVHVSIQMCVHVSIQMCVPVSIQMCVHVSTQMCKVSTWALSSSVSLAREEHDAWWCGVWITVTFSPKTISNHFLANTFLISTLCVYLCVCVYVCMCVLVFLCYLHQSSTTLFFRQMLWIPTTWKVQQWWLGPC